MNFNEYQQGVVRTISTVLSLTESRANAAMGLAGESGEVVDIIKKEIFHRKQLSTQDLGLELGDVLFYLTWLCELYGLTLEGVALANNIKLNKRFPNGFNTEDAAKKMDTL